MSDRSRRHPRRSIGDELGLGGRRVRKNFEGNVFFGTIDRWDADEFLYHIQYDDGDEEEMPVDDIEVHLVPEDASESELRDASPSLPKERGRPTRGDKPGKKKRPPPRERAPPPPPQPRGPPRLSRLELRAERRARAASGRPPPRHHAARRQTYYQLSSSDEDLPPEEACKPKFSMTRPPPQERPAAGPPSDEDKDGYLTPSDEGDAEMAEAADLPPPEHAVAFAPDTYTVPEEVMGDLVAAYNVLRGFSWQLKLSPFSLQELVAAVVSPKVTNLMDEIHVCLLRTLSAHESLEMRARHKLDLSFLDWMTWPEYVWEWAASCGDHDFNRYHFSRPGAGAGAGAGAGEGEGAGARAEGFTMTSTSGMPLAPRPPSGLKVGPTGPPRWPGLGIKPPKAAEYYTLPPELKAAVLNRLCNEVLDCGALRGEIDRREAMGLWRVGPVGQMKPRPEEDEEEGDLNFDTCVLCQGGGNLICCDSCPGAYHIRCMGESQKSLGDDPTWLCEECKHGGRGEAGGLRVPCLGLDAQGRSLWAAHRTLFASRPDPPAPRRRARAPPTTRGLAHWPAGPAADQVLASASLDEGVEEAQAQESVHLVEEEAAGGLFGTDIVERLGTPGERAMEYYNKYRNGWGAVANAAAYAWRKQKKDRKAGKKGDGELLPPLPLSRYQWPSRRPRGGRGQDEDDEPDDGATSRVFFAASFVINSERQLWGLLRGSWEGEPHLRRRWLQALKLTTDAREVAKMALELEAALDPAVLLPGWAGAERRKAGAAAAGGAVVLPGRKPGARGPGRPRKDEGADVEEGSPPKEEPKKKGGRKAAKEKPTGKRKGKAAEEERRKSGRAATQKKLKLLDDFSDLDDSDESEDDFRQFEAPAGARCDWENSEGEIRWLRKGWLARSHGAFSLPRAALRCAARRGGGARIEGVVYNSGKVARTMQMGWRARVEACTCTAELGLCLRQLEGFINWELVKKPAADSPAAVVQVIDKRVSEGGEVEYLTRPMDPLEEVPGKGGAGGKGAAAAASAREIARAEADGGWAAAGELPLWPIKVYEERVRRERAAEARAMGSSEPCSCGKAYGDPADTLMWVGCDSCDRWYHGKCVGLSNRDIDNIGDDEWDCPDCAEEQEARRERLRERRARRGLLGGRNFKEKVPKVSKKMGRPKKHALGADDGLYCVCRTDNEDGAFMIACDYCDNWYHPECVGLDIEEAQEMEDYKCQACYRKRKKVHGGAEAAPVARCEVCARVAHAGGVYAPLLACKCCGVECHPDCSFPPKAGAAGGAADGEGKEGEREAEPPEVPMDLWEAVEERTEAVEEEVAAERAAVEAESKLAAALRGGRLISAEVLLAAALVGRESAAAALSSARSRALRAHRAVAAAVAEGGVAANARADAEARMLEADAKAEEEAAAEAARTEEQIAEEEAAARAAAGSDALAAAADAAARCEEALARAVSARADADARAAEAEAEARGAERAVAAAIAPGGDSLDAALEARAAAAGGLAAARAAAAAAHRAVASAAAATLDPLGAAEAGDGGFQPTGEEEPIPEWTCEGCKAGHGPGEQRCALCPWRGGPMKRTTEGEWAHILCALWVPECHMDDAGRVAGVRNVPDRRWRLTCNICKFRGVGAIMQCASRACGAPFHPMCARMEGLPMREGDDGAPFESMCKKHALAADAIKPRVGGAEMTFDPDEEAAGAQSRGGTAGRRLTKEEREREREAAAAARVGRDGGRLSRKAASAKPSREDDDEGPPGPPEFRPSRPTALLKGDAAAKADAALPKLVRQLFKLDREQLFWTPVDTSEVPDYEEVCPEPMDLSTIQERQRAGEYLSSGDGGGAGMRALRHDVELMCHNCMTYNAEGSEFWELGAAFLEAAAGLLNDTEREAKGLAPGGGGRKGAAPAAPPPKASGSKRRRGEEEEPPPPPPAQKKKGSKKGKPLAPLDPGPRHTGEAAAAADAALPRLLKELGKLDSRVAGGIFAKPVDPAEAPDYETICPDPMDLSTVKAKHRAGAYKAAAGGLRALRTDIALMCSNCMTYNVEGFFYDAGRDMLEGARAAFDEVDGVCRAVGGVVEDVAAGGGRGGKKGGKVEATLMPTFPLSKPGPIPRGDTAEAADASLPSLVRSLYKLDAEKVFAYPVDPAEVPGYEDICPNPMDLSTIRAKQRGGEYKAADGGLRRLRRDVELMCHNCMTYNEDGSGLYELGERMLGGSLALIDELEGAGPWSVATTAPAPAAPSRGGRRRGAAEPAEVEAPAPMPSRGSARRQGKAEEEVEAPPPPRGGLKLKIKPPAEPAEPSPARGGGRKRGAPEEASEGGRSSRSGLKLKIKPPAEPAEPSPARGGGRKRGAPEEASEGGRSSRSRRG